MGNLKWIAGGLGFVLKGPIGGLIGLIIGWAVDELSGSDNIEKKGSSVNRSTMQGDFSVSLLVLIAAVMKADGRIVRSELDYVKQHLLRIFGPARANEALRTLGDLLKNEIPVRDVCRQMANNMDYSSRLQLLHLLFGISAADNTVSDVELSLIRHIAENLKINLSDFESIKAMFVQDTNWAYKVLEIEENSTPDDIKKAYRKMAVKFHPDKVAHLGEEFANEANEKFQKVNQAYEELKKRKGFN